MTPASRPSRRVVALAATTILAVLLLVLLIPGGSSGPTFGAAPAATTNAPESPTGRATASTSSAPAATPASGLPEVPESRLPSEAADTLVLVRAGGPYPYAQDDRVFGNRERLLPGKPRGYYREYTVVTPGESDRGPRRLVVGDAGDIYWTTDHYASFRQVEVGQ
ncbi:MAG: ribonuclease domain-containing protein [Dermatophilaceae bacterium]